MRMGLSELAEASFNFGHFGRIHPLNQFLLLSRWNVDRPWDLPDDIAQIADEVRVLRANFTEPLESFDLVDRCRQHPHETACKVASWRAAGILDQPLDIALIRAIG